MTVSRFLRDTKDRIWEIVHNLETAECSVQAYNDDDKDLVTRWHPVAEVHCG